MVDASLFYQDVYGIVKEIPVGRVATYKQIAVLVGFPQHARWVGRALRNVPDAFGLPCHRVVNGCGRLVPSWPEQKALLEAEGVAFRRNGNVDMRRYAWSPDGAASVTF